jgi:polyhydroxyalkanoate synthase
MTSPTYEASYGDPGAAAQKLYDELDRIYKATRMGADLASGKRSAKIAQTPKEAIWHLNKATLYHYFPQTPLEKRHQVPLLLVFALINRPDIFDLRPGNSFVEFMLQQGYEVYLLDWGRPGPEDSSLKLEDYALDLLPRAIRKLQSHSGSQEFTLLGWCIGAVLTSLYAAWSGRDPGLKNLLLLTAPLDFSKKDAGPFNIWLDERYFNIDALVEHMGNVPGEMIDWGNKMLKPVENFIGNYIRLWENLDDPRIVESWQAMNAWVNDPVPFAGASFRQWVVDFFRENKLMNGTLTMRGELIDLQNIEVPLLSVIADKDHIVPTCQSIAAMDRIGSQDKTLLTIPGGHIGIMAGSGARKRTWPQIDQWLAPRSK